MKEIKTESEMRRRRGGDNEGKVIKMNGEKG